MSKIKTEIDGLQALVDMYDKSKDMAISLVTAEDSILLTLSEDDVKLSASIMEVIKARIIELQVTLIQQ